MVQTRIPGIELHSKNHNFTQLTDAQQCAFVRRILRTMQGMSHNTGDKIEVSTNQDTSRNYQVRAYDVDAGPFGDNPDLDEISLAAQAPVHCSTHELFLLQFGRWKTAAKKHHDIKKIDYSKGIGAIVT